jgi:hypothetical protein
MLNDAAASSLGGEPVKALIIYVCLVIIGAVLAALFGVWLEYTFNPVVSLIVFLTLFFANFVVSWVAVIYIMDGTLRAEEA